MPACGLRGEEGSLKPACSAAFPHTQSEVTGFLGAWEAASPGPACSGHGPGTEGWSPCTADGTLSLPLARNILWLNISVKKVTNKNGTCSRERAAIKTPGCLGWRLGVGSLLTGPDRERRDLGFFPELLQNQNCCSDPAQLFSSRCQVGRSAGLRDVRSGRFQS